MAAKDWIGVSLKDMGGCGKDSILGEGIVWITSPYDFLSYTVFGCFWFLKKKKKKRREKKGDFCEAVLYVCSFSQKSLLGPRERQT